MCTKPFPPAKIKGKLFLVATSSGPLLGGRPFNFLPKSPVVFVNVSRKRKLAKNRMLQKFFKRSPDWTIG